MIAITPTVYCLVCEKELPMSTGYMQFCDGSALACTCKQCNVSALYFLDGGHNEKEKSVDEFKKGCHVNLDGISLVQKNGLFDTNGEPIYPLLDRIKRKADN